MDRPVNRTNLMWLGLICFSSLVGCAYHNMNGGGACGGPYGGASGGGYPPGSGAVGTYQQSGPAPNYQAPARPPAPGSGFFGSGGY
ncbi:MAG: hypothetical protein WKF77_06670 [Planctomycetaceae bacterium]